MADSDNKGIQSFWQRLQNKYRLVLMNEDTFEEVASYRLSRMNVYVLLSCIIFVVAVFVTVFIVFTPVRQYIPGYGDLRTRKQLTFANKQLDSIEKSLLAKDLYIKNLQMILSGQIDTLAVATIENEVALVDSIEEIVPIEEDIELRKRLQEENANFRYTAGSVNFSKATTISSILLIPPIVGAISQEFQPDKKHFGIDIIAPKDTPVKTIASGVVVLSEWTQETGNTIAVQHPNNLISFYKHNAALLKKNGDKVEAGEAIAIIGNSGELTDGPHLHFELWYEAEAVNPADYIFFGNKDK